MEEGHLVLCKKQERGKDGFSCPFTMLVEWRDEMTDFYNLISKKINLCITFFQA